MILEKKKLESFWNSNWTRTLSPMVAYNILELLEKTLEDLQVSFQLWLHNCLLICIKDEACYDTTTNVYEPYTRKNSPDDVSKDHCDKLSYVTKEGEMFPLCDGDCSCCRPSVTQGNHVAKTL